jgi:hypothetical protein
MKALIVSWCMIVITGASQQELKWLSRQIFGIHRGRNQGLSCVSNLIQLTRQKAPPSDSSPAESHTLYDIASFQFAHEQEEGRNRFLDLFIARGGGGGRSIKTTTRGGSSVIDDDEDESATPFTNDSSSKHLYSVTSTLVHGNGETTLESGCLIAGKNQHTKFIALWDDNTPALWKTLAFLSDTLTVGLTEKVTVSPVLIQALQAGLMARKKQQLRKPRLVFILHPTTTQKQELKDWKDQLAVNELAGISEQLVDSFQIIASHDLLRHKIKARKGGISKLADAETFPCLVRQVHHTFGGSNDDLLEKVTDCEGELEPEFIALPVPDAAKEAAVENIADTTRFLLESAIQQLEQLQEEQELASLEVSAGAMPFDFATQASPTLLMIATYMARLSDSKQAIVQQQVGVRIQQLYQQQLSLLRDYYGRLYETMLDSSENEIEWKRASANVLTQFRKVTAAAVPDNVEAFGELDLDYLATGAASGLLEDMKQALELRQALELESDADETDQAEVKKVLPVWYKKLAARGLVLGVNYLQGWLAWQGIKRAALQREKNLPKFPLF